MNSPIAQIALDLFCWIVLSSGLGLYVVTLIGLITHQIPLRLLTGLGTSAVSACCLAFSALFLFVHPTKNGVLTFGALFVAIFLPLFVVAMIVEVCTRPRTTSESY